MYRKPTLLQALVWKISFPALCTILLHSLDKDMSFNPNFESIGQAFVQHYYQKFDVGDPSLRSSGLSELYDIENSYMTFEGTQMKGRECILQKFSTLAFKNIQRMVTKIDCQPLADGSVMVAVLGQLKVCFALSIVLEITSVGCMKWMARPIKGEKDQILDAGLDLNLEGGFGEYCKDIVILSASLQILSLLTTYFWLLFLCIPLFAFYKLWVNILGPWFFAGSADDGYGDDRKKKRKEKRPKRI